MTRRQWLGALAVVTLATTGADEPSKTSREDDEVIERVRERAAEAGIKNVGAGVSAHFVGVGNASPAFRGKALKLCEDLAATFLKHFRDKGFDVKLPGGRMAVVTLADKTSYAAFKGREVGEGEGGYYDVAANWLVNLDFDQERGRPGLNVRRLNTFTLVHEATHQLTFNTGLLDRHGDVPVAVSEGLATYGELWRIERPKVGQVNGFRLDVLKAPGNGEDWFPVNRLLADDALFADPKTEQLAYAEAWLLVYELLGTKAGVKRLLAYLKALRPRRDPVMRLADAQGALGDLDRLDDALKRRARLLG